LDVLGVDRKIILKWMIKELDGGIDWIDLFRIVQVVFYCECGNEPWGSIKFWEYLDELSNC
jgi:hypothetical protein